MKPLYLKMKAFGPYAKEAEIQFTDFDQGIYLITGDTGAGKTTIFDAIVFALFGEASGSNRSADMMHSDFVPKSEKTEVLLKFSHGGRTYDVYRTLRYIKLRGAEGYRPKPEQDVILREEGRDPTEKKEAVNARIEEIIGLDAEQFRKIVMLAQGEFRAFLEADNNVRGEILGKLFNNKKHQNFQNCLRAAEKQLREQREEYAARVRYAVQPDSLRLPADMGAEQRALYGEAHPYLAENLIALVDEDDKNLEKQDADRAKIAGRIDMAKQRMSVGSLHNQALDRLDAAKDMHFSLAGQAQAQQKRRAAAERAARALHLVRPVHLQQLEKQRYLAAAADKNRSLSAQIGSLEEESVRLRQEYDSAMLSSGLIDSLKMEIEQIDRSVPDYDALEQSKREISLLRLRLDKARSARDEAEQIRTEALKTLSSIDEDLRSLEGAGENAARLQNKVKELQRKYTDLSRLSKSTGAVFDMEKQYAAARDAYAQKTSAVRTADQRFHELNEAFIAGQAVLLADELAVQIQKTGSGICPVCGTAFGADHPPVAPRRSAQPVTKQQVDKADEERKRADEALSAAREKCSAVSAQIESARESAVQLAQDIISANADWDLISREGFLAKAINEVVAEGKEVSASCKKAVEMNERLTQRKKERDETQKKADESLLAKEAADAQTASFMQQLAALEAAANERALRLAYPAKNTALERRAECSKRLGALQENLDTAARRLESARDTLNRLQGEQKSLAEQLEKAAADERDAGVRLGEALAGAGFADMDDYAGALLPIGDEDGEKWLENEQRAVRQYDQDCRANEEQLASLIKETQGYVRTDIGAMEAQLAVLQKELKEAEGVCAQTRSIRDAHAGVLAVVQSAQQKLKKTDLAYARLRKLADIASGLGSDGGKWSFDKFAVGEFFREILQAANVHLSMMSGGQYELVHQTRGDRKNSAAGLNIEVYDGLTHERRKTASLSGGESFQVSMSLALGLSGTVQAHAGGQKVDAMFIDEGFGSLDDNSLDKAIGVLDRLAGGTRQIGIISHVAKLEECVPQKIIVKGSAKGSSLDFAR